MKFEDAVRIWVVNARIAAARQQQSPRLGLAIIVGVCGLFWWTVLR